MTASAPSDTPASPLAPARRSSLLHGSGLGGCCLPAGRAAALCLALWPAFGLAQASAGKPLWELGVVGFAAAQPAYPGSAERTQRGLLFPFAIYRGQYLRADSENLGLRAIKTDQLEVDIGVAGSFGARSSNLAVRQGMPDLGTLVEFGPRLKWQLGATPELGRMRAEVALRGVFDLSDGLRHRGTTLEPRLMLENRTASGWNHSTSLGLVAGSRKIGDTLYGVAPEWATGARPEYRAASGLMAWRLGLSVSKSLSPDWTAFGFARLESVAGAANRASPLVQQRTGATLGMGLSYTWARSTTLVND
jgi:outer membrane protein